MKFVCGGSCQGKREWAAREWSIPLEKIADGGRDSFEDIAKAGMLDHFHLLVRRWLERELDPQTECERLLEAAPDIVVVTDEIGSGIIPMDPFEQQWREAHGRICCRLAAQSEDAVRVVCGIGMRLKEPGGGGRL